jgi:hypothetical protein
MGGLSSLRPRISSGGGNPDFGAIDGGVMKLAVRNLCGSVRSLRESGYFFFAQRTQRTAEGAEVFEQVQTTSPLGGAFLLRAFAPLRETNLFLFSRQDAKTPRKRSIYGPGSNIVECAADVLRLLGHNMPTVGE